MPSFLKISGILYEYLNTHAETKLKAEILYWLGICDNQINSNFFYSLSDLYFKECILSYPEDPFGRRCFDEYKKNTLAHYMIHNQNRVPKGVERALNKLEKGLRTKI